MSGINNSKNKIFDKFRRKYVAQTPEEIVRQNFCNYLVSQLNYPTSSIANECVININQQLQRCDTVVYKNLEPAIIVEYKAPNIEISQSVFDQIIRYNSIIKAPYIVVCNGKNTYCCKINFEASNYEFITELPDYNSL